MNIMYATDDNYAEICGVSIESLLYNNKDSKVINFFVVVDQVTQNNLDRLEKTVKKI